MYDLGSEIKVFKDLFQVAFIDPVTYVLNLICVRSRTLEEYSHFVASRDGLFAASEKGWKKVIDGQFFGITKYKNSWYCFQSNGLVTLEKNKGRIIVFEIENNSIINERVFVKNLPNGCHQIDYFDGFLNIVDTYNTRIIRISTKSKQRSYFYPFGIFGFVPGNPRGVDTKEMYPHMNSLIRHGSDVFLIKHNLTNKSGKRSEVVRCNKEFEVLSIETLNGGCVHNIVFVSNGVYMFCDSLVGDLVSSNGERYHADNMFTRGLSIDTEQLVVGSSKLSYRRGRRFTPGKLFFYNRNMQLRRSYSIPAAPTDIRKIDGEDYGLSNSRLTRMFN